MSFSLRSEHQLRPEMHKSRLHQSVFLRLQIGFNQQIPFPANVLRAKVILVPPRDKILFLVPIWDYHIYMKIIAIKTLRDFWLANPDAEQPLKAWVDEASKAEWKTPAEIKEQYRSASILKNRRVVFNIKGNDYRLIVAIAYQRGWMFIKFVGTHKEYDKIDAETVNLE